MPSDNAVRREIRALRTAKRDPSAAYLEARVYLMVRKAAKRKRPYVGRLQGQVGRNHKVGGV